MEASPRGGMILAILEISSLAFFALYPRGWMRRIRFSLFFMRNAD
jgi:hypothetical protein